MAANSSNGKAISHVTDLIQEPQELNTCISHFNTDLGGTCSLSQTDMSDYFDQMEASDEEGGDDYAILYLTESEMGLCEDVLKEMDETRISENLICPEIGAETEKLDIAIDNFKSENLQTLLELGGDNPEQSFEVDVESRGPVDNVLKEDCSSSVDHPNSVSLTNTEEEDENIDFQEDTFAEGDIERTSENVINRNIEPSSRIKEHNIFEIFQLDNENIEKFQLDNENIENKTSTEVPSQKSEDIVTKEKHVLVHVGNTCYPDQLKIVDVGLSGEFDRKISEDSGSSVYDSGMMSEDSAIDEPVTSDLECPRSETTPSDGKMEDLYSLNVSGEAKYSEEMEREDCSELSDNVEDGRENEDDTCDNVDGEKVGDDTFNNVEDGGEIEVETSLDLSNSANGVEQIEDGCSSDTNDSAKIVCDMDNDNSYDTNDSVKVVGEVLNQTSSDLKNGANQINDKTPVKTISKETEKKSDIKTTSGLQPRGQPSLWVSGIASNTRAADLKALFHKHGRVVSAKVVVNAKKSGSRCYGFVTMTSAEEVSKCIQFLHRTEFHGKMIALHKANQNCVPAMGGAPQKIYSESEIQNNGNNVKVSHKETRSKDTDKECNENSSKSHKRIEHRGKQRNGKDKEIQSYEEMQRKKKEERLRKRESAMRLETRREYSELRRHEQLQQQVFQEQQREARQLEEEKAKLREEKIKLEEAKMESQRIQWEVERLQKEKFDQIANEQQRIENERRGLKRPYPDDDRAVKRLHRGKRDFYDTERPAQNGDRFSRIVKSFEKRENGRAMHPEKGQIKNREIHARESRNRAENDKRHESCENTPRRSALEERIDRRSNGNRMTNDIRIVSRRGELLPNGRQMIVTRQRNGGFPAEHHRHTDVRTGLELRQRTQCQEWSTNQNFPIGNSSLNSESSLTNRNHPFERPTFHRLQKGSAIGERQPSDMRIRNCTTNNYMYSQRGGEFLPGRPYPIESSFVGPNSLSVCQRGFHTPESLSAYRHPQDEVARMGGMNISAFSSHVSDGYWRA